jgi:hypothetical protein
MDLPSEAVGIHQSDVVIRSAIMAGIADLRANPWLLDYAFASLAKDTLTQADYGQREIDNAKRWFLATRIPVFLSTRIDDAKFPCISISLMDSNEAETTLSDVHYQPTQDDDREWPALTPTFAPESWNHSTGILVVPKDIGDGLVLAPGMQILDADGVAHQILDVLTDYSVKLTPGIFRMDKLIIKGNAPAQIVNFESVRMKETYALGCHVQGEQIHLTYLHSILVFVLYRYKMALLEARGFERSTLSSSDFRRNEMFESEFTFSRHINITGYVTHTWPAEVASKVTETAIQIKIIGAGKVPPDTDLNEVLWAGDQDVLLAGIR